MSVRHPFRVAICSLPPEGIDLRGEVAAEPWIDLPADGRTACPFPVAYDLHVGVVHGGILARGRLRTRLWCRCDRCLAEYEAPLAVDDVCHLYEITTEETVDLTLDLREDILLAFPQRLVCREGCRGLCPSCGRNLNDEACGCADTEQAASPWSVLDRVVTRRRGDG